MIIKKISFLIACLIFLGLSACSNNFGSSSEKNGGVTSDSLIVDSKKEFEYATTEYSGIIVLDGEQFYFQNTEQNIYAAIKESATITYLFTNEKASITNLKNGLQAFADIVIEVNPAFIGDYALGDVVALCINT